MEIARIPFYVLFRGGEEKPDGSEISVGAEVLARLSAWQISASSCIVFITTSFSAKVPICSSDTTAVEAIGDEGRCCFAQKSYVVNDSVAVISQVDP